MNARLREKDRSVTEFETASPQRHQIVSAAEPSTVVLAKTQISDFCNIG
jgi:hypothetical protein